MVGAHCHAPIGNRHERDARSSGGDFAQQGRSHKKLAQAGRSRQRWERDTEINSVQAARTSDSIQLKAYSI